MVEGPPPTCGRTSSPCRRAPCASVTCGQRRATRRTCRPSCMSTSASSCSRCSQPTLRTRRSQRRRPCCRCGRRTCSTRLPTRRAATSCVARWSTGRRTWTRTRTRHDARAAATCRSCSTASTLVSRRRRKCGTLASSRHSAQTRQRASRTRRPPRSGGARAAARRSRSACPCRRRSWHSDRSPSAPTRASASSSTSSCEPAAQTTWSPAGARKLLQRRGCDWIARGFTICRRCATSGAARAPCSWWRCPRSVAPARSCA